MSIRNIPGDICKSIFSRLPVRSVLACKCVCKSWLNLISNSDDFVQMHLEFHRENSSCRLMFCGDEQGNNIYIHSIGYDSLATLLMPVIEDDEFNIDPSLSLIGIEGHADRMDYPFKNLGLDVYMFGSCNGCVCLWFRDGRSDDQEQFFCLWNPATNEYKRISDAPKRYYFWDIRLYAFVYDPTTDDYKLIIAIHFKEKTSETGSLVYVYTLASDSWKSFLTPYSFSAEQNSGVLFNGDLHWLAVGQTHNSIVSLDIKNEKFEEIQPPLARLVLILLGVLDKCLCVLVQDENDAVDIWAMQVYGDPKSWTKCYTVTHEIITSRIRFHRSRLRFMWSFKNGVILFTSPCDLVLYDPEHGSAIEQSVNQNSAENYSQSLVSLNSGTYAGERTLNSAYTELQILMNRRNSVLEARNAELQSHNAQLVASNAELQRKLHQSQVAYQHLEQRVNAQKYAEESKKEDEEENAMTKKNGRKRKEEYQYNTRRASKAVAAMSSTSGVSTNFEDKSITVQQRDEKEQAKLVLLPTGGTLEPYQIKEGSENHSTSEDSYQTLTVERLRALLKERGLMVKGKKDELIARLRGK